MPKLKTSKSAQKRLVNITKHGKYLFRNMSAQHLTSGKSKRTLSRSSNTFVVHSANLKTIKKLLPNK